MTIDVAADVGRVFDNQDLTETVSFKATPNATGRDDLLVNVMREGVSLEGGDDKARPFAGKRAPRMLINLRNHASLGVLPTEIIPDVSTLYIAYPKGATTEAGGLRWYKILRIVGHTAGVVQVEVQT